MKTSTSRSLLWTGLAIIVVVLIVLIAPPARSAAAWVLQKTGAHRLLTVPLAVLGALFLLSAWRRRLGLAALCLLMGAVATGAYGLSRIDARYPHNIVGESGSITKVWRLVSGQDLLLSEYDPQPTLVVAREPVERASVPAIDIHFHLGSLENLTPDELVTAMDATGIERVVNVDGAPGAFDRWTREAREPHPDRFVQFSQINFQGGRELPGPELSWLRLTARFGAQGVKVHKALGLNVRDEDGTLVPIDDPRLDPVWDLAGELGLPVLIHTADPTPFWYPTDRTNERYEELMEFPSWSYADGALVWNPETRRPEPQPYPTKEELLRQRNEVIARHPETIFIGAHMGGRPHDLATLAEELDAYPNFYVDIASRIPELGRQPYTAREFFIRYQDRILFGTDGGYALGTTEWTAERYFRAYLEFLQTANENIEYPLWGVNKQGRWRIHGLDLPDDVLRKILHDNAAGLLGLPPAP